MQTTIDIPEEQVAQLDKLSHECHVSRDELVRLAVSSYLQSQDKALDESFGAWGGSQGDGVEYQQRLRDEWLAAKLRRTAKLKMADAVILATARVLGCPLVTRNTRDFDRNDPSILVPYEI